MSETVWASFEKTNYRLVNGGYHYDAFYVCECPECDEQIEDSIDDLESSGCGICMEKICPHCGTSYVVCLDECENDDDKVLSVVEAAEIWASNGKDEDNMFGYSAEELEDAL